MELVAYYCLAVTICWLATVKGGMHEINLIREDTQSESAGQTMTKETLIRRYLLDDLPQDERTKLEDLYFTETDTFEELVAAENDLIDSYVRDELSGTETKQFEAQYCSTPALFSRVEFARSLSVVCRESNAKTPEGRFSLWTFALDFLARYRPFMQWSLVATALVLTVAGSWLYFQNQRLRSEVKEAQAVQDELRRQAEKRQGPAVDVGGAGQSQKVPPSTEIAELESAQAPTLTFTLNSGALRGGESAQQDLVVPSNVSWVLLQLPINEDQYVTYQADLQTVEGRKIRSAKGLSSRKSGARTIVVLRVPSNLITSGDYIVMLTGSGKSGETEEVESYSFRALRK